ncbi:MAG TPA: hypothetical protein DCS93_32495, partial [Microscillaceae bacterium]|nr:hypothetical protein [Microscillaceae bacterium]
MVRLLLLVTVFLLSFSQVSWGQFTDDFSDGNFTANPVWSGSNVSGGGSDFTVVTGELRNNGPAATATIYLSTPIKQANEWTFRIKTTQNPSGSNYVRVYLRSDQADLTSSTINGYYIEAGRSSDNIDLVKVENGSTTTLVDGTGSPLNNTNNDIRVKVTLDASGNWVVTADLTGGTNFSTNVGSFNGDNVLTSAITHFGVYVRHTSTRNDDFFFDDFDIKDTFAPTITTAEGTSANTLDITFSEEVDQTTAETTTNYSVNNSVGNPTTATRDGANPTIVHLTFGSNFSATLQNTVTVQNVQDLSSNAMASQNVNFAVDVTPPTIASVQVLSATTIDVTFSENVD